MTAPRPRTAPRAPAARLPSGPTRRAGRLPLLAAAAIAVAALAAFATVVPRGDFVFDDHVLIERNFDLQRTDVLWKAFGRDYYATSEMPGGSGYYRPIAVLTHALDRRTWGVGPRRRWHHLTSLVLHAGASLALAAALRALGATAGAAGVAALFFAAHPVHAESVAFVSGRVDVLAALGIWLAMAAAASARRRFAVAGLGLAALAAFLSKEIAVVLPLFVLLVWRAQPAAGPGARRAPVAALAAAAVVALGLRRAALHAWLPVTARGAGIADSAFLPLHSLLFALAAVFAPVRELALEPEPSRLAGWRLALGAGLAVAVWGGAWLAAPAARAALRRGLLAAGLALIPVANVFPQETVLSERFLYLASGFLLLPAGVLLESGWRRRGVVQPMAAGAGAVVLLCFLAISTWRGVLWRSDLALWNRAVQEEPDRAAFWDRLGLTYLERRSYGPAEEALRRAVALDPRSVNAQVNLGGVLHSTRRFQEAIVAYERAIELQPNLVNAHINLGLSRAELHDLEGAYQAFLRVLAIKPDHFDALHLAGGTALELGRLPEARRLLEAARRLYPQHEGVRQLLVMLQKAESGAAPQR